MKIENKLIGDQNPAFLIAEVAQSHDGSLGAAHAFIDAAADVGADAIKFQTHIAEAESTIDEPFRVAFSRQDETRYAYWKRMEFREDQWLGLANHARQRGLVFLSSPFSVEAVKLLKNIGMSAWKVGSGELNSRDILDSMIEAGGPVLLSTGMSTWSQIDSTVNYLKNRNSQYALFQCTTKYPTPLEEVGINLIQEFSDRYSCPVGLSDHSGNPFSAILAIARGCHLVELHVTFDRRQFGPDVSASVTFEEFELIRRARDDFAVMNQNPVDKNTLADQMKISRGIFGKSIALSKTLVAGTILTRDMLRMKKPGTGITLEEIDKVIGKRLSRTVPVDRLLKWDDLD
jgi:N,N'-diacetyllegionaminate synthase